jgi:hypothetical protein
VLLYAAEPGQPGRDFSQLARVWVPGSTPKYHMNHTPISASTTNDTVRTTNEFFEFSDCVASCGVSVTWPFASLVDIALSPLIMDPTRPDRVSYLGPRHSTVAAQEWHSKIASMQFAGKVRKLLIALSRSCEKARTDGYQRFERQACGTDRLSEGFHSADVLETIDHASN